MNKKDWWKAVQQFVFSIGMGSLLTGYLFLRYVSKTVSLKDKILKMVYPDGAIDERAVFFISIVILSGMYALFVAPLLFQNSKWTGIKIAILIFAFFAIFIGVVIVVVTGKISLFCTVVFWMSLIYVCWISIDVLKAIYNWVKTSEGSFDLAKMTFIWGVIVFILGKVW